MTAPPLFAHAIRALKWLLAASATFQAVVGAANAQEALAFIYEYAADDTADDNGQMKNPRPRAIVNPGRLEGEKVAYHSFKHAGTVLFALEFPPPASVRGDFGAELHWFAETLAGILADMETLEGQAINDDAPYTHLVISDRWCVIEGPGMAIKDEENNELFYGAVVEIDW